MIKKNNRIRQKMEKGYGGGRMEKGRIGEIVTYSKIQYLYLLEIMLQ